MSSPTTPELESDPDRKSSAGTAGTWHDSAPRELIKAYPDRSHEAGWETWRRHLAKRRRPRDPGRLLRGKSSPLEWAFVDEAAREANNAGDAAAIIGRLQQINAKKNLARHGLDAVLHTWLSQENLSACGAARALECVAWCQALPSLSAILRPDTWWELYDSLTRMAERAAGIDCGDDPLAEQLLCCELPLTLAYLFPELTQCVELGVHGRRELAEGLSNFLDDHGLPNGQHLPILRPLLACWTRSLAIARKMKLTGEGKSATKQYRKLVRQVLRLSRRDGSQVLSNDRAGQWNPELIRAAVKLAGDGTTHRLGAATMPGRRRNEKRAEAKGLPKPAVNSEWAELAVLRPSWSRGDQRLTVNYHGRQTQIELDCGRDLVLSGTWDLQVSVDGQPLTPTGPWEEVCWESDRYVDYLEIEIQLSGGVRAQRQMVLARKEGFLYLADAILSTRSAEITYCGALPLGADMSYVPEVETRDGLLQGRKPRGVVMPLALPEWRSDPRFGSLESTETGLELRQSMTGVALYAPLWIDLERRRVARPRTWRQLTVGEDRQKQPRDVAVGYRVQVGKEQWLIYRSMTPAANRTVLGHNLVSEFLIGRFTRKGEVTSLVEIDAE